MEFGWSCLLEFSLRLNLGSEAVSLDVSTLSSRRGIRSVLVVLSIEGLKLKRI